MLKIFAVIILLYLIPCCVGNRINYILKIKDSIVKNFVIGNIFIWALFQAVTVPLVFAKASFSMVVFIVNIVLGGLCVCWVYDEMYRNRCELFKWKYWKKRIPKISNTEMISMIIMEIMIVALIFAIIFLQHTDADDSRFVVNAMDIVRTNRLFLTDLITGQELETWIGEIIKDITSPWAVYIAYYSKMTGLSAVIIAHSILPVSLIVCALGIYWLIADEFFKKEISNKCIFLCVAIILNVYGHYSVYSAETFLLSRVWQGKATVAGVAIPAGFLLAMWLYENYKKYEYYILIAMLNLGMCLMSGMGLIIGAIMLISIGMIYSIVKKNICIVLGMGVIVVPNVIYFILNEMQPNIR